MFICSTGFRLSPPNAQSCRADLALSPDAQRRIDGAVKSVHAGIGRITPCPILHRNLITILKPRSGAGKRLSRPVRLATDWQRRKRRRQRQRGNSSPRLELFSFRFGRNLFAAHRTVFFDLRYLPPFEGRPEPGSKKQLLCSIKGVSLRYTGEQLDQSDLDVWEQAVHLARLHPLGNVCHFTAYSFLKALGHGTGKAQYKWLSEVITRLVACEVELSTKERAYGGNLITSWKRDEVTGSYALTLNPDILRLYSYGDWTALDWEQRLKLRGKPLALWLHGFYSSHAKAYLMLVETLHQLSGAVSDDSAKIQTKS